MARFLSSWKYSIARVWRGGDGFQDSEDEVGEREYVGRRVVIAISKAIRIDANGVKLWGCDRVLRDFCDLTWLLSKLFSHNAWSKKARSGQRMVAALSAPDRLRMVLLQPSVATTPLPCSFGAR